MRDPDVLGYNRKAWDQLVARKNPWTQPVSSSDVERARRGQFTVVLTPVKPVPAVWFPPLQGADVLCLACGGGQQAPLLAAAGANVTVFDNSPKQLGQDRLVAERDGLDMNFVQGDMADLGAFGDGCFDLVFHPCSNTFIPNVLAVWKECGRVVRNGGKLMAGFTNPLRYLFDDERKENGNLEVCYSIPYSDLDHLDQEHIQQIIATGAPLEFGHTLADQIGGQLHAGFRLTGLYEDRFSTFADDPLSNFVDTFIATCAEKIGSPTSQCDGSAAMR